MLYRLYFLFLSYDNLLSFEYIIISLVFQYHHTTLKDVLNATRGFTDLTSKIDHINSFKDIATRTSQLNKYRETLKGLNKTHALMVITSSKLTDADKKYYASKLGLISVEGADIVAKSTNITATDLLSAATARLSVAWAKLTAFMSANPLILLGTVAVGLIGTVYGLAKAYEHFTVMLDKGKHLLHLHLPRSTFSLFTSVLI